MDSWQRIAGKAYDLWSFQLVTLGGHGVTLGNLTVALFVLITGAVLAGYLRKTIHRRLLSKSHLKQSSIAITEKLIYYFLVLIVLLFALRLINIPLTAFTFLGGALAIGVGFGAQKLINNFISGFILMAEQPIKVGDLIEMNGELGWIDDIGVRSTRVRTFANINILIPNSYFLENNIINWTHNDNIIRCEITVGVVYGSPTDRVKELLIQSALENTSVLRNPEPFVWFTDFGDNALIFRLMFWITLSPGMGRQQIESEVRFVIDRLFRAEDIVIAFPQRDVHIDASRPITLQYAEKESADPAGGRPAKPEN
jgi:potassium efflux system protein